MTSERVKAIKNRAAELAIITRDTSRLTRAQKLAIIHELDALRREVAAEVARSGYVMNVRAMQ